MKAMNYLSVGVGTILLTLGAAANAQSLTENTSARGPAEVFGGKGQLAISSDAALAIERRSLSGASGGTTSIQLAPAADYFIVNNLSVGGFVGFDYIKTGDNSSNRFSIGPRVGYDLLFSDFVSIWPKVGVSFAHTSSTESTPGPEGSTVSLTTNANAFSLNLFAPIVIHPTQHFFAGFGPFLDTDLSGARRATAFGDDSLSADGCDATVHRRAAKRRRRLARAKDA
jgi:hypothetical protein